MDGFQNLGTADHVMFIETKKWNHITKSLDLTTNLQRGCQSCCNFCMASNNDLKPNLTTFNRKII